MQMAKGWPELRLKPWLDPLRGLGAVTPSPRPWSPITPQPFLWLLFPVPLGILGCSAQLSA